MTDELSKIEHKIVDFLISNYKIISKKSRKSKGEYEGPPDRKESARLSKSKRDFVKKIDEYLSAYALVGEIITISKISPAQISRPDDSQEQQHDEMAEYVREENSKLDKRIIENTLEIDLSGKDWRKENIEFESLKKIQRDLTFDIFTNEKLEELLDAIFVFHPEKKILKLGEYEIFGNEYEFRTRYYSHKHRERYHELAYMLIKRGMAEIIKNLDSKRDKLVINYLLFTINIIKNIRYQD